MSTSKGSARRCRKFTPEFTAEVEAMVEALAGWIETHAHTRYRFGGELN